MMRAAVLLSGLFACSAQADFFNNTTGLESPLSVVTFEDPVLPRATQVKTQYASQGVTFTPYVWYDIIINELPGITGHRVGNTAVGDRQDPFSIHLTTPRRAVGFAVFANDTTFGITALREGVVVETATPFYDSFQPEFFFGFTGIDFDEIRITQISHSGSPGVLLDNIQLGEPVPAPGALGTLVLGVLACRRRRRHEAVVGMG